MSAASKAVLEAEDRAAGRFLPSWAYHVAVCAPTVTLVITGGFDYSNGFPLWSFIVGVVGYLVVGFGLIRFKKRGIV